MTTTTQIAVSAKHKMLGIHNAPPDIQNLFPAARELDPGTLLVPHGLTETFLLRKLGYQVPSPILTHYDWPGATPFDVQRKTCAMLTMNQRAFVLNGMGTGKTKAALWAWDYLRSNNFCGKLLVVAPLSTLSFVWAREIFSTLPHRKCVVLHGSKEKRLERLKSEDAEIYIINHDGIKVLSGDLLERPEIDCLVVDELAVYRNGKAARTKTAKDIAKQMKWVWGLTGSPMPNAPTDVWSQCQIVAPGSVPKYFGKFRDELMTKVTQFKYVPKPDAVDRAFAVMQPAVRFKLDDVVELPECIERTIDVELGPKQAKAYRDIASACYHAVQSQEITAANAGAAMSKLLQVSTGWVYTSDGKTVELDNGARIQALIDSVLSADNKVLVFAPFIHSLEGISSALTTEGIEHACVSGDTAPSERTEIFTAFQNSSKYKALVAHPQCLAHGVTLTAADTIIWFAPITSGEIYEQANARIRRVGQKNKQLVLHFQSTPVEKKIYSMLQSKQKVQDAFLHMFEEMCVEA
jgi:SNF2 family DNA or RNA helicase